MRAVRVQRLLIRVRDAMMSIALMAYLIRSRAA